MTTATTPAWRRQEAARLRAAGLEVAEIGARLGVKRSTVYAYLEDPDGAKARRRRARYVGACEDCGAPTDGSRGPGKARRRCAACAAERSKAERWWTRERVLAALDEMEDFYGEPVRAYHVNPWILTNEARRAECMAVHRERRWPAQRCVERELGRGMEAWRWALAEWRAAR